MSRDLRFSETALLILRSLSVFETSLVRVRAGSVRKFLRAGPTPKNKFDAKLSPNKWQLPKWAELALGWDYSDISNHISKILEF